MQAIDEAKLEDDLGYRFQYLTEFMGFGEDDIAAIHGAAAVLAPLVPSLVDAVYDKLSGYSSTWRHFAEKQHGYDGELPADAQSLTMDAEVIKFRKEHLARYLTRLVTNPYDAQMVQYLDLVGKIHTPLAGAGQLAVPLVQMNALMGFVADAFVATILSLNLDRETEVSALRAFNKLLWLQNDLISRHYCTTDQAQPASTY
jgi:hypothetical protein